VGRQAWPGVLRVMGCDKEDLSFPVHEAEDKYFHRWKSMLKAPGNGLMILLNFQTP